jgi:beta-lactamase regulating signal transducer with metallopeptidase domain
MNRAILDPLLQRLAWTLVHFLWQGIALGLLAWGVLTLLRRQRPQIRYTCACCFLGLCALVPFVTFLRMGPAPRLDAALTQTVSFRTLMALRGRLQPMLPLILWLWSAGVGFFALRALGGWVWLHRLCRQAQPVLEDRWQACVDSLRQGRKILRAVPLLESPRVQSPFTTGLLRPVILVPLGFFAAMDPLAAEAVLAHELAHIRRLDVLVIGLQTVIETLLFYHPAVWWISRRVANEREHCCDDDAVKACGDAVFFAHVLKRLDDLREAPLNLAPAAEGGDLMERIKRLLAIQPGPVRFTAPGISALVAIVLSTTTIAAQQEPVRQAVQQVVSLGSRALHGSRQEAQGAIVAARQFQPETGLPTASTAATGERDLILPPPPARAAILADQALVQPPESVRESEPIPSALPNPARLAPSRLGFAFKAIPAISTRIDPWPEGADHLEAKSLPPYDPDAHVLRFGPTDGSDTPPSGQPTGSEAMKGTKEPGTRLLSLTIPPASQVRLSVRGTLGKVEDPFFAVHFLELKSLMPWGCWVTKPKRAYPDALHSAPESQGIHVITNASSHAQKVLAVIAGPRRHPYRITRTTTAIEAAGAPSPAGYVVEPWPASSQVDSASAPGTSTSFEPGLVALFPGAGKLISDYRRDSGITQNVPVVRERDWHPNAPGFPEGLIKYAPVTHLRCFALDVQPGEQLEFKAALGSEAMMEVVTPRGDEDPQWLRAVEAANEPAPLEHTRSLKVANPGSRVQKLILVVYCHRGMDKGYTIELKRGMAAQK